MSELSELENYIRHRRQDVVYKVDFWVRKKKQRMGYIITQTTKFSFSYFSYLRNLKGFKLI